MHQRHANTDKQSWKDQKSSTFAVKAPVLAKGGSNESAWHDEDTTDHQSWACVAVVPAAAVDLAFNRGILAGRHVPCVAGFCTSLCVIYERGVGRWYFKFDAIVAFQAHPFDFIIFAVVPGLETLALVTVQGRSWREKGNYVALP